MNLLTPDPTSNDANRTERKIKSSVIVADNEVLALGGLIKETVRENESRVPLLGSIPLLGWFFKNRSKTIERTSVLVLILPEIIRPADIAQTDMLTRKNFSTLKICSTICVPKIISVILFIAGSSKIKKMRVVTSWTILPKLKVLTLRQQHWAWIHRILQLNVSGHLPKISWKPRSLHDTGYFYTAKIGSFYIFTQRTLSIKIEKTAVLALVVAAHGKRRKIEQVIKEPIGLDPLVPYQERVDHAVAAVLAKAGPATTLVTSISSALVIFKEISVPLMGYQKN